MDEKGTRGELSLVFCNSGRHFGEKVKKEYWNQIVVPDHLVD